MPVSRAARAIGSGEAYLDVPYVWGGTSPATGFDCSGFVQHVYAEHGIRLPRVSRDQARAGTALPADLEALQPGDLMFFASRGTRINHVAIYAGDGRILHASKGNGGVGYDDLRSERGGWFRRHFVAARRVIPEDYLSALH
jgi:cell wall-associated NlpC family hydrolase